MVGRQADVIAQVGPLLPRASIYSAHPGGPNTPAHQRFRRAVDNRWCLLCPCPTPTPMHFTVRNLWTAWPTSGNGREHHDLVLSGDTAMPPTESLY